MRMLLVALLLGNVLLGIYNAWPPTPDVGEPAQREIAPERIHLLDRDQGRKMSTKGGPRASLDGRPLAVMDDARASTEGRLR